LNRYKGGSVLTESVSRWKWCVPWPCGESADESHCRFPKSAG
jgi:hypothetical protein